jgi:MFS family permease
MNNFSRWIALIGISLLAFVVFFDFTVINTVLPFIQIAFKASVLKLQWIVNIFIMVITITMLPAGRIADLLGRQKVLYFGIGIFAIAVLGAGFSTSLNYLMIFRGLQGLGISILFVVSASLISEVFSKERHSHAIGIYGGITGIGLAAGPFIGGLLIKFLSWRWVFWINLPIVMIGFFCCLFGLRLSKPPMRDIKIDWKGLILLTFGLGWVIYGIITLAEQMEIVITTWLALIGGLLLLIVFFVYESHSKSYILDVSLFKNIPILLSVLSCFLAGIISCVFMFFDPLYLHNLRELSALKVGLLITFIPAIQVIISFLFHFILKWIRIYTLMLISITAAVIGISAHRFIGLHSSLIFLLFPFGLLGVTWGISNAGTIFVVNQIISKDKIGVVLGTIFTLWNMVGSIFLAISSALFHKREKISFMSAFYAVVDISIVFSLLLLAISIVIFFKFKKKMII